MPRTYTVAQLAGIIGGTLRGDGSATVTGVADVLEAGPTEASWISREKFEFAAASSRAALILVPKGFPSARVPTLECENLSHSISALLEAFAPEVSRPATGVHPSAVIHDEACLGDMPSIGPHAVVDAGARIGARCILHAGVFIGRNAILGDDCEIWPNAVVRDGCILGSRVIIHSCAVIGADGFGFYFENGRHVKIPHIGSVRIEDDVEIGACTCVDRAKFGFTVVGGGTKIDNQVQVAHNCRLGRHNILAGQSGLSGSVRTGDFCLFGARVVSFDNLSLGNNVRLAAISVVTKDLPSDLEAGGFPAQDLKTELRERAAVRRLPGLNEKIKELMERVERLESAAHHKP